MTILMSHEFKNPYTGEITTVFEVMLEGKTYLTALDLGKAAALKKPASSVNRLNQIYIVVADISTGMKRVKLITRYGTTALVHNSRKGEASEAVLKWLLDVVLPLMEQHEMEYIINKRSEELAHSAKNSINMVLEAQVKPELVETTPKSEDANFVVVDGVKYFPASLS